VSTVAVDTAFDFAAIRAELEQHLDPAAAADSKIARWYNSARIAASEWLGNDWTDDDGADIPKGEAVIELIKDALFEGVRAQHRQASALPGLLAVSTGSNSETYGAASGGGAIAMVAMAQKLYPLALNIERF
jgi:hypothetical protein